jgi:hypothetical protein
MTIGQLTLGLERMILKEEEQNEPNTKRDTPHMVSSREIAHKK